MDKKGFWAMLVAKAQDLWKSIFDDSPHRYEFRYHLAGKDRTLPTAGDDNAWLPEKNGRAVIDKVYGKTVKFNQLFDYDSQPSSRTIGSVGQGGTITKSDNGVFLANITCTGTVASIAIDSFVVKGGSKYYFKGVNVQLLYNGVNAVSSLGNGYIYSPANDGTCSILFRFIAGTYTNFPIIIERIDLTAAEIDNLTTVEQVESWLALNVGTQDYYPYDEGSLISFKRQGVKSVGWNKWDENTYLQGAWLFNMGDTFSPSGTPSSFTTYICGSHIFPCLPNKDYYAFAPYTNAQDYWTLSIIVLDKNLKVIQKYNASNVLTMTTASDAAYLLISHVAHKVNEVMVDIVPSDAPNVCVNLSDLAKNGTYEPYKEEIVDLSGAYINVWDEIPAYGTFSSSNGETFTPNSGYITSQNKIKVVGGKTYYFKINQSFRVFYYDASGTFISSTPINATETSITLDSNVGYIRFQRGIAGTYKHDICINVSNADINGTYFPHALQSAGSVMDEDTATELTKKLIEVDLGNLVWQYRGAQAANVISTTSITNYAHKGGKLSVCYPYSTYNSITNINQMPNAPDKCHAFFATSSSNALYIKDSDIAEADINAQGHCQKLEGVILIYELATPITIPHDTPMQYKVDKYSTEEVIFPESDDGSPTSTNIVVDIDYQKRG